jgi:hypothetical protein
LQSRELRCAKGERIFFPSHVRRSDKDAALTIRHMRSLLECISFFRHRRARHHAGILIALLTGLATKLRPLGR